jgi:hypothetical protein
MSRAVIICAVFALACGFGVTYAQVSVDPELIDLVAEMEPGQSIVRNNSKLTLKQRNAGTRDADGWFLAKSSQGGFSVRFPAPANDETYSAKGADGLEIEQNILFSETSDTRFVVTCLKQNKFQASAATVDQIVKAIANHSQHFKSAPFTNGALAGMEYTGVDAQGTYFAGQSFLLGNQFCQFLVGSPSPFEGIPADIRTSFASFRPSPARKVGHTTAPPP